jgi:NADH-quinone oxidoreductase subunit L
MQVLLDHLWLIVIPPLAGAAIVFFFRRALARHGVLSGIICSTTIAISFVLSALSTAALAYSGKTRAVSRLAAWIELPGVSANWSFLLDPLSAVMILVVTGIGLLIHIYSIGYMRHEEGTPRFFGYMNLFVLFMLLLLLADNYLMLFAGWEGVGLCSYLLIGFHFERRAANAASMKAFLTNRLGDIGLLLGIFLVWQTFGTVEYAALQESAKEAPMLGLMTLLLAFGAAGKSAQFPLFTWLPDAMEGPTPVSALIHAATMVTAGVYLVARSAPLYALTPDVSTVIGIAGAITAVLAASVAIVQHDIKRILAYSTVSQLGYMFMALGAGAYWVAIFHVFTHAFFKALLFLGAGSVIHSLDGEQDIRHMGGLWKKLPITHATMAVAALAIAGVPGLAGFFSKDEILLRVFTSPLGVKSIYLVGIFTSYLTGFYMWRLMTRVFYGPALHPKVHEAHESPASMTVPLATLAAGTLVVGWLGAPPSWNLVGETFGLFERWLRPVFPFETHASHDAGLSGLLMAASVLMALASIYTAWVLYVGKPSPPTPLLRGLYHFLTEQWYIDRLYQALFVERFAKGAGSWLARLDDQSVDGAVIATASAARQGSDASRWSDHWIVDNAVHCATIAVEALSYPARLLQTGRISGYAAWLLAALLLLIGMLAVRP